jgi:hypothetical protein
MLDIESYGLMMMGTTGPTGPYVDPLHRFLPSINVDPTAPTPAVMAMFPSAATGPVEVPTIATMEELMASYSAIVAKETADTQALSSLINPTRDQFRPQLFQWAAAGFPDIYVVQSISVTPPAICADGVTREIGKYIEYRIGKNLGEVIDGMKALMAGIQPSWSMSGNALRIHVTKA